ncbi:hypothetical protein M3J09_012230 [Ascochyta lentis]
MATSNSQDELDIMRDSHLPDDQALAAAALSGDEDALTGNQELKPGHRFGCPHCSKTYITQKSLTVHDTSAVTTLRALGNTLLNRSPQQVCQSLDGRALDVARIVLLPSLSSAISRDHAGGLAIIVPPTASLAVIVRPSLDLVEHVKPRRYHVQSIRPQSKALSHNLG